ncbi:MAG TPA: M3 family metallopeptidase, partial [Burkholderiaceae bacterium]|nr:M3 family metallopeptidase [Burkholderiaceae bacterium]
MNDNPLLDTSGLPAFDRIRPEHVTPAIESLLAKANEALERAVSPDVPAEYEALSAVLDVATERLGRSWGAVNHLKAVADSPELRAAFNENLPRVTEFHTRMGSDDRLYAKYKAIHDSPAGANLSAARRRALSNALRDFVLSGAELRDEAKRRFAEIQEQAAQLSQKYSEHVLDATDGFSYYATDAELQGVPADVKQAARDSAAAEGREGHKITLHFPSYFPVMQYGANRALRETLYRAYVTRASDVGSAELDNSQLMAELLRLRQEEARLLGYPNFSAMSLVPKMAETPEQVTAFLRDLAVKARAGGERDLTELRDFAARELGLHELQAWDIPYASERLKESRYAFSEQEVKQYFTAPKALAGLFQIVQTLFEVT